MKYIIYIKRKGRWEYHSECQSETFKAIVMHQLAASGAEVKSERNQAYRS